MKAVITLGAAIFCLALAVPAGALVPGAHISSVTRVDEVLAAAALSSIGAFRKIFYLP